MTGKRQEHKGCTKTISDIFGENVFSLKTMRQYLATHIYKSLESTIRQGKTLDPSIADEVAEAMKTWALERGASHFTHWFQPLTGATAEKHDSFLAPDSEGGAVCNFSGTELIRGESDASSFPSGGLRSTFEARGYTAWDPTSPAFVKKSKGGATLCIPTIFCSYHGESLDKKTPLLRSLSALNEQVCRLARLFHINCKNDQPVAMLGAEQEYFLIDKDLFKARQDLVQTGRTLFGRTPAKHQQLEDHYFGVIKGRILAFMNELDIELWRLGVPAKTRHNEACPGQFEIAPVFEELNLAVDHNMLIMETLREVADRHGFACLLHEKPFEGMNGSGKHNNWSIKGPDGKNWMAPGGNPLDNARFLTMLCAFIKAVDTHAALLRAATVSAGNDRRLGSNEAPPPVISIFLGRQLSDFISDMALAAPGNERRIHEESASSGASGEERIMIGVSSLPHLPRDMTDRNRTSPLAFTGDKFEFRAVGSSQSCAGANIVLNTIIAEALDAISSRIESDMASGMQFNDSLNGTLKEIVVKHKRILFDGDSYSEEWRREAARRGLPILTSTPDALKVLIEEKTMALFEKYNVLSSRELRSRHDIYQHTYIQVIDIEANCAVTMARTLFIPVAFDYRRKLAETIRSLEAIGANETTESRTLLARISSETENILKRAGTLEAQIENGSAAGILREMDALRLHADELEKLLPAKAWPVPSYADMMFKI